MNQALWQTFEKLRSLPHSGHGGLAEYFRTEGIRFAAEDLSTWAKFVSARFARSGGAIHVPEWLARVFCELAKDASPTTICDPYAGVGFLLETLRESCVPAQAYAFAQIKAERELGEVLCPNLTWRSGDPLQLLGEVEGSFDVVASILPMNARSARPISVTNDSGERLELGDDLGNQILVETTLRLSASGVGLFVVTPSFFSSPRSVRQLFQSLGLGIRAALALPAGSFAPYTNISAYLLVVGRAPVTRMFVAQISGDENANFQVLDNLRRDREGGSLELGRFADPDSFISLDSIRIAERLEETERRFGTPSVTLQNLATEIRLGRYGDQFAFTPMENSVFIPMIGSSDVVVSIDDLTLKCQNYAQVVVNPAHSHARFVASFLNSDFGREVRKQSKSGSVIPKLNRQGLLAIPVFVPDIPTQKRMLEIEARIAAEQNTLLGLQNELNECRRDLWSQPGTASKVEQRLEPLSHQLRGAVKAHAGESLEQWFETLPFPLASILRAWQATPSQDFKTRHEHLLHFFEATAEFLSVILLSAFSSNEPFFGAHKQKLVESMQKQNVSLQRATFGTWKLVVDFLGKQVRLLLTGDGKKPDDSQNDRAVCANIFADPSLRLPEAVSRKELAAILSTTNKMRNDWSGHGGVVGQEEARLRNELLLGEVQKLREVMADTWAAIHLIQPLHCRSKRGIIETEIQLLMGSNSEFLKETRQLTTLLDVDRLYLSNKDDGRALTLIPLIRVGPSPRSAKNACYFFSRLEGVGGARFVSYHYTDTPELSGHFSDATEAIRALTQP